MGPRAHRANDRSRRFFRPQLLMPVSARSVPALDFESVPGFGSRGSSSICFLAS
jgi:hypothetical protein